MTPPINTHILGAIIAYVAIQFAIGAWVSRRMASDEDYIVAGRSLGTGLVAFSVFATWFGAEAIQVSAGEIYEKGLSGALVDPFGYGVAVILVGLLLAAPLWRQGITTFADVIRARYSPLTEKLFVLVLVPGSVFWAAAQIRAFGQILSSSAGLDVGTAIVLAGLLIGGYSVIGGLLADAITDVVQGLAVIVGLLVLTWAVMTHMGGFVPSLASIEPARLDVFASGGESPLARVEKFAVTICGSIVSVELISRFLGASSVGAARTGTLIGGALYLAVGFIPIFLGLVGPNLIKGLTETEQIVPKLAEAYLPAAAYALFLGALVSAILSVVHAALHAPAAQLSHNILIRMVPGISAHAKLWCVRLTVLALSFVALLLARSVDHIKDLVETASAFGSAGAFVVAIFGIFTRIGGPASAITSLLTGILMWIWCKYVFGIKIPYLTGLAAALSAYLAVAWLESRDTARRTAPEIAGKSGADG